MTMNMLVFEYRNSEKKFFETHNYPNYNITFFEECLNEDFIEKLSDDLLNDTNIISVFVNSDVTKNVIKKFKNLRIISTRSTAYDHICLNVCEDKNIALVNVPKYGETAVAQFTIGLMISLIRNIIPANKTVKNDDMTPHEFVGRDLTKLTLGVIGTGAVGGAVCALAQNFGLNVFAYDVNQKQELVDKINLKYVSLDELKAGSDIISVHIPYMPENHKIFNEEFFSGCKDNSYFINISSSKLVCLKSLYNSLINKKLKGIGLDSLACLTMCYRCSNLVDAMGIKTFECMEEVVYINKLKHLDNVIITPHIGYETQDSIDYILEQTMENIKKTLDGEKTCRII